MPSVSCTLAYIYLHDGCLDHRTRLLKERARRLAEERCGLTTTDEETLSELRLGAVRHHRRDESARRRRQTTVVVPATGRNQVATPQSPVPVIGSANASRSRATRNVSGTASAGLTTMLEEREPTEPSLASLIIDEKTVGNARVSSRAYAKPAQNSTELIKNGHVLTPEGRVKEHRTPNSQKNLVTMTTV